MQLGADRIWNFEPVRSGPDQDEMIRLAGLDRPGSGCQRKNLEFIASLEQVGRHHHCTGHTSDLKRFN